MLIASKLTTFSDKILKGTIQVLFSGVYVCDIFCTTSSHQINASLRVYKICQSNAEQFHFLLKVFLIDVMIAFP